MDNKNEILFDSMKTYFSYNPHVYATLKKIKMPDNATFILTPYRQKDINSLMDILMESMEEGDFEHMVRLFVGAFATVEYATQTAAILANVDYNNIKETCDREDFDDFDQLIVEVNG